MMLDDRCRIEAVRWRPRTAAVLAAERARIDRLIVAARAPVRSRVRPARGWGARPNPRAGRRWTHGRGHPKY